MDRGDPGRAAISGSSAGGDNADLTFAPGFGADYAVVIEPGGANLFRVVEGGAHEFLRSLTTAPSSGFGAACSREMNGFSMADLGSQPGNPFRWVVTLLNPNNAFRSNEFQGVAASTGSSMMSSITCQMKSPVAMMLSS